MPGNLSRGCPSRHTPSRGPRGGARRGAARGFLYLGGADSRASRAARPRCPHHPPPPPPPPAAPRAAPAPPPRPAGANPAAQPRPARPPRPPRLPRRWPAWLARAGRLLVSPAGEWLAIAGEFTTAGPIYTGYLVPMAAIGPLAATLGTALFGERSSLATLGDTYPMSLGDAVTSGVLEYGLNLAAVSALAAVIERLAPLHGAPRNRVQALKLAAYGTTPYWLGGALGLFPKLAPIGVLLGLYAIRLFRLGVGPVLKVPREKAAAYTVLVAIAAILAALVIGAATRLIV